MHPRDHSELSTTTEYRSLLQAGKPFLSHPSPENGATDVPTHGFQISAAVNVPDGYELYVPSLMDHVHLYEQTDTALIEVPANYNDTGGGDAITLTPTTTLKPATTYVFSAVGLEANRIGDVNDRITFKRFSSQFTTSAEADTNPPVALDGVAFTQVFGNQLGAGTQDRFTSLVFGPDGKLYASTLGNVIKRWTVLSDGTLTDLEELTINLQPSPHPITGVTSADPRLIIGLAFAPESRADSLVAYVSHSAHTLSNGPEWDGKITRLSGPNLQIVQDIIIHLPRSKKDHLTNSIAFGPGNDLFFLQGSNSAGGEPDAQWDHRPERLLSAAALRLRLSKLPASLPLSVYTSSNINVINQAPATGLTLSDGSYNPYSEDSPLILYATGVRNAYDLVFHSNGWLYIPTNGTAGNNTYSPNMPASAGYLSQDTSGIGIRRPNGTFFNDATVPGVQGGETQKDWLFKTRGGSYHGHPNPFRGEFVLNHGGVPYSGLPGQLIPNYRDVEKYPVDLPADPNFREVAYDFDMNKSPNGVIEYRSNAFEGKLQGMLLVARFSGQDDIIVLQPGNNSGDIIQAFEDIPGLQSLDDPLDITEHVPTGNLYVAQYDRGGSGNERLVLMRVDDPTLPSPVIAASPEEEVFQATVGVASAQSSSAPITITNDGQVDLHITYVVVDGVYATRFSFTGPKNITLAPGASQQYVVTYRPTLDDNDLGYQQAELVFQSDGNQGAPYHVGLHALKVKDYGGSNEPVLQDVVNVLGVSTDIGWNTLTTTTGPGTQGDEVVAPLFEAAGPGTVSMTPIARYSTAETLPFGYYTHSGGVVQGTEIAAAAGTLGESQTLYPELSGGSTSFTPPAEPFGLYVYSGNSGQHTYTEDGLNEANAHRARSYPVLNRDGIPVPNQYVVCIDEDGDGDYQDYVFMLSNVQPVLAGPQVLAFAPESLTYSVYEGGASQTQSSTVSATNGSSGDPLTLQASEPWVILPTAANVGESVSITVDPTGLAQGTYLATVTAAASNYTPAELQLSATVNSNAGFSAKINFQDNSFSPPTGYLADVGLPYGDRGALDYGWINPYTKSPQDNTAAARGAERQVTDSSSDQDKLNRSFNMLDWGKQVPPVPRDWEIAVPNGVYLVQLSAGDPNYTDSRHTIRAEGVVIIDDFVPTQSNYRKTGSAYVEVKDGRLTIDDNGAQGIGNSKINYVSIEQIDLGPASGALVRIENLTKTPFNNRSFPSDEFFTFHRMDHSFSYHGNALKTHEKNNFRIHNDGTAPLVITNLTTTSTKDFTVTGITIPPGGLTINPGGFVDATLTFVSTGLPGPMLVTDKLVLESNADNNLTTHITLRGAFMRLPEGGNEITTQQTLDALGFITEMGRDANGRVIDRPGSDYPTDEDVNAGKLGDMILSRFWLQDDPNEPIRLYQLAALHGPGYAPTEIRNANRSPIDGFVFRHGEAYHQALLPRLTDTSPMIAGRDIARITVPFQVMIAGYSTAGGSFDGSLSNEILGCRAYKAIDRDGNVIPNEFILIQDYIESGCGPGTANCDFQDNIVYMTNVRPVDLPSAGTIPNFTVASLTPSDYRIDGYFDRGYAGNRLLYRASLVNGASLPSWISLEGESGTFTFNAPASAVGKFFDITVTATDDNLRMVTSDFRLTVNQGTGEPANQPPQAVAVVSPSSGIAPLQVTLNGSGSSDSDGTIVSYVWTWTGGSASGASPQVTFAAGTYTITLTVTDDDGAQDTDVVVVQASPPSNGDRASSFWLEAECAETGSLWRTETDASASNGSYVVFPSGNSHDVPPPDVPDNRIRFALVDVEAGNYHLFARVLASDGGNDSYWVRINNGTWIKWNSGIAQGQSFNWNELTGTQPFLIDGYNTIDFAYREDGTKLDKIHLDKDPTLPADTGEAATNCGGVPGNAPPVAVAAASPTSGTAPLSVQLDGSGSTDNDGSITQYAWSWSGGSASGSLASATFAAGTHAVTLTVTDDGGAQATDVVTITASGPPPPPGAKTSAWLEAECAAVGSNWATQTSAQASNGSFTVPTTGSASTTPPADLPENLVRFVISDLQAGNYHLFARIDAPSGTQDSYWVRVNDGAWFKWNSGMIRGSGFAWNRYPGGQLALINGSNTVDFALREAGTALDKIHLDLESTLPSGAGDPATNCDGTPSNVPPIAVAAATPTSGSAPLSVQLDGSGSSDSDGSITQYAWSWSGGSATGSLASATFAAGTHAVTLTVTDDDGAQATDVVTITASEPPPPGAKTSTWLEAECAAVGSNWATQTSAQASNGSFTVPNTGSASNTPPADLPKSMVRFVVSDLQAGNYHLFVRIDAPSGSQDSYWVRVNEGAWFKWNSGMIRGTGFAWNRYPGGQLALTNGTNTVDFALREAGTALDKIHLDLDATLPTGTGDLATNCSPNGDADGDGVADTEDNCPNYYNPDQTLPTFYADLDGDGYGDPNDSFTGCPKPADYVDNNLDNCPSVYSTNLTDSDNDGLGDACDPDTPPAEVLVMEAECGALGSGWQTRGSGQATGGQYIVYFGSSHTAEPTTPDPTQEVTYNVSLASGGTYHLFLRLNAPDGGRNSFWIRIDGGSWIKMWEEIGGAPLLTNGFEWRKVNHDGTDVSLTLTAGNHTITVANREAGTELDKLVLSPDATLPIGEGPAATNCGPAAAAEPLAVTAVPPMNLTHTTDLVLFPNPAYNELNVRWLDASRGATTIMVTDVAGRRLMEQQLQKETDELQITINTADLPQGTYRVIAITAGTQPRTAVFVRM
ncbi:PKD domain-containing protein [Neolewinella litorea]|uniref:PKD domain-containing protein n=1 Tax=Neolewinella litorea TaxID=2562452 RepID=UPI00145621AC|nr:PKD domain-containing protein [Neolewinella litorea]